MGIAILQHNHSPATERSRGACVTNTARRSVEFDQPAQFPLSGTPRCHTRVRRDAGARFHRRNGEKNCPPKTSQFPSSRLQAGLRTMSLENTSFLSNFRISSRLAAFPNHHTLSNQYTLYNLSNSRSFACPPCSISAYTSSDHDQKSARPPCLILRPHSTTATPRFDQPKTTVEPQGWHCVV